MATISNQTNPVLAGQMNHKEIRRSKSIANKLEELIGIRRKAEALEVELKVTLKDILKPAYFSYNEDAIEASDVVHSFDLDNLQINFTTAYFIKDNAHLQTIIKLLGAGHPLADTITESAKVTVDVTDLSPADANELAKGITKLAVDYGIRPQVDRKAVAKQEFHDLRHVYLSKEDNLELDKDLPLVIQVTPIK